MLITTESGNVCWPMTPVGPTADWPVNLSSYGVLETCPVQGELSTRQGSCVKDHPAPEQIPRKINDPRDSGLICPVDHWTSCFSSWGWVTQVGLRGPYSRYIGCPLESQGNGPLEKILDIMQFTLFIVQRNGGAGSRAVTWLRHT